MSDDDVPRIRLWGDSTRGHRVHPGTAQRHDHGVVDLATIDRPPPSTPRSSATEPLRATARLAVRVLVDDGTPIADADLEIVEIGSTVTTDDTGLASVEIREGHHEIRFVTPPAIAPRRELSEIEKFNARSRTILVEAHRTESFWLSTGERTVAVRRPKTTEILLDGYAQGSTVMRWGGTRPRIEVVDGMPLPVVGTARGAAAAFLVRAQGMHALVVGHADPQGSDEANAAVAAARARSTQLYLAGEHGSWADDAAANASEVDFACALSAFAAIMGIDRPALDDAPALEAVCAELHRFGGDATGEMTMPTGTADEWRILAEAYDLDLARLLGLETFDLQRLRERITWVGQGHAELGEQWPRQPAEFLEGDAASLLGLPYAIACRRSSLHVLGRADAEALAGAEDKPVPLYDGTFGRTIVETPSEVEVLIRCTDPIRAALPGARVWIRGALGVQAHVADAAGLVRFLAIRHSRFDVVMARQADQSGTLVDVTKEIP